MVLLFLKFNRATWEYVMLDGAPFFSINMYQEAHPDPASAPLSAQTPLSGKSKYNCFPAIRIFKSWAISIFNIKFPMCVSLLKC